MVAKEQFYSQQQSNQQKRKDIDGSSEFCISVKCVVVHMIVCVTMYMWNENLAKDNEIYYLKKKWTAICMEEKRFFRMNV